MTAVPVTISPAVAVRISCFIINTVRAVASAKSTVRNLNFYIPSHFFTTFKILSENVRRYISQLKTIYHLKLKYYHLLFQP